MSKFEHIHAYFKWIFLYTPAFLVSLPQPGQPMDIHTEKKDRFGCAIAASSSHCSFCSPAWIEVMPYNNNALAPWMIQLLLSKWLYHPLSEQAPPLSFSWTSGISLPGRALHHTNCKDHIQRSSSPLVCEWVWHHAASADMLSFGILS